MFLTIFDGKQKLEVFAIFFVVGNMRTVILYLEIFFALFEIHIESITKYFEKGEARNLGNPVLRKHPDFIC